MLIKVGTVSGTNRRVRINPLIALVLVWADNLWLKFVVRTSSTLKAVDRFVCFFRKSRFQPRRLWVVENLAVKSALKVNRVDD